MAEESWLYVLPNLSQTSDTYNDKGVSIFVVLELLSDIQTVSANRLCGWVSIFVVLELLFDCVVFVKRAVVCMFQSLLC